MKFLFTIDKNLIFESKNIKNFYSINEIDQIEEEINKTIEIDKQVIDSLNLKDTLNHTIWKNGILRKEMKEKLTNIAEDFIKSLELPDNIKISDIIFTGSLTNYNWSKYSDVDIHVIIDFKQFKMNKELLKDYLQSKKTIWNNEHDITIYDYPVELYVQDVDEELHANSIFSISKDKWLKKPFKEKFEINKEEIKKRAKSFLTKLKDIKNDYTNKKYEKVIKKADKLKGKIKNMRKSGLENDGEYSIENLTFKVLRRTSFIEELNSLKSKAYDKMMTI